MVATAAEPQLKSDCGRTTVVQRFSFRLMTGTEKEPPAPWITAGPARLADMTAALNAAPTTTVPRAIRNHLMSWPHCYLFGMGPAAVSRRYSRRLKVDRKSVV